MDWCGAGAHGGHFSHGPGARSILGKIGGTGLQFRYMLAMPKNPTTTVDLGWSPDALVLHLIGGELAIVFENFETMFEAMNVLRSPVGASRVYDLRKVGAQPVALYVVP